MAELYVIVGIANEESQTNEEIDQSAPHASLLDNLIRLLHGTQVSYPIYFLFFSFFFLIYYTYHAFFAELRKQFNPSWKLNPENILSNLSNLPQLSVDPTADENQKVNCFSLTLTLFLSLSSLSSLSSLIY